MRLQEWCVDAQQDQIVGEASHLYANYRHSVHGNLIDIAGMNSFVNALREMDRPGQIAEAARRRLHAEPGGFANYVLIAASQLFGTKACPPSITSDFRVDGNEIPRTDPILMLNLRRTAFDPLYAASGTPVFPLGPAPRRPGSIIWLTRPEYVVNRFNELSGDGTHELSPLEFFRELTSRLGLKQLNKAHALYELELFKIESTKLLVRPHALSGGYPDRFCGDSSFSRDGYGATIDNRNGEHGLTEAVLVAGSLSPINSGADEYLELKTQLSRFANWIDPRTPASITAELPDVDVHSGDLRYAALHPIVLGHLRHDPRLCGFPARARCACC